MASASKNLSSYDEANIPNGESFQIGIVVADWNAHITHALYDGCVETLLKHGVKSDNIHTVQVPGSFELPAAAKLFAASGKKLQSIICLGCVIKGETKHDEYINHAVAQALTQLSILSNIPCIFGVLTPNDEEQALDRAGGKHGNKGVEAAITALRMAELKVQLTKSGSTPIGF